MKLIDQIMRKPVHIAFGQALAGSGITSVDLAAVRNASTVTVTASDGSAAPIPGADASTAGVMTAADKAKLDGLTGIPPQDFAIAAHVAAANIGAGITYLRTAGYAAVGDGGDALYKRIGAVPGHALYLQSGDGAYWELVARDGTINVLQAGADPTGVADSIQAFRRCADFARYNTANEDAGGANGPTIIVPQGKYHWSDTFEPRVAITMIGAKRGVNGNVGTIIQVAANKSAIILPKHDTAGLGRESPDNPLTKGANGSHIYGLLFQSLGGTDQTRHGIIVRTSGITLEHVDVRGFPGDGIHIRASVGTSDNSQYGNANHWVLRQCMAHRNRLNGIFIDGSDANAGVAEGCNVQSNGRWGVWDDAFLSNVHIGHHAVGNGHGTSGTNQANAETATVTHAGEWWQVVPEQETAASTTTPGTNAAVWFQATKSGGTKTPTAEYPAWVNGGTYVSGGSYYFSSGVKTGIGLYAEDDNWAAMNGFSNLIGGFNSIVQALTSAGGHTGSEMRGGNVYESGITLWGQRNRVSKVSKVRFLSPENPNAFFSVFYDGSPGLGQSFAWDGNANLIRALTTGGGGSWAMEITTDLSTLDAGRGSIDGPKQGNVNFPNGLFMGVSTGSRFLSYAAAAPTAGKYARGDTLLNRNPTVQTDTSGVQWILFGWKCAVTGTPGTWHPLWTRVSNPPGL